ncbi:Multidrug resistance protein 3 [Pigmentiphaga humi]|uniref:Multidrug resistance protein 3 n=2 Tax=Pigmentiphaga humi TaxID=2478468 RepID=A0A3P4AYX5_9BURK|nr:MDR family MFS transporter [Pigmentiphaga humi]VCU68771.1 Multidrug resistance protein 3 [Pigmentiphaga humi]
MSTLPQHSEGQVLPFRQSLMAVLGMCFVMMMVAIDQTVVGTALPTIVAELRGFDLYAWVATAYLLPSVITIPIFGRLGDYYGRKPFVIAAILVFTLASVLCGAATSMLWLVVARALQGIGGGMLVGCAFACIPDLFPEPRVRLRWQIIVSSAFGIANAIGPSLGGVLTEQYGWRSVFYVNVPVGLLGILFIVRFLPHIRHHTAGRIQLDWPGALLIAVALGGLQMVVELLPKGSSSGTVLLFGAASLAAFAALYVWEQRTPQPLLPIDMFRNPALAVLFLLAMLVGFIIFALMFYAPLLLQGGFGLSPQQAGLLITPMAACITVGSILNGRIISHIDRPNRMLYAGFGTMGLACLGIVTTHHDTPHALFAFYMFLAGLGIGFTMPNLTIFAQHTADRTHLGIATATLQSTRMIGGMLGTAIVGTIVSHSYLWRVTEVLQTENALQWLPQLHNPQILVDPQAQRTLAEQFAQHGGQATELLEHVRQALVSGIHNGQILAVFIALVALWLVRRVPAIQIVRPDRGKRPAAREEP